MLKATLNSFIIILFTTTLYSQDTYILKDLGKFEWKMVADSLSGRPLSYIRKRSPAKEEIPPKRIILSINAI